MIFQFDPVGTEISVFQHTNKYIGDLQFTITERRVAAKNSLYGKMKLMHLLLSLQFHIINLPWTTKYEYLKTKNSQIARVILEF